MQIRFLLLCALSVFAQITTALASSDHLFLVCDGTLYDDIWPNGTPINDLEFELDLGKGIWFNGKEQWPIIRSDPARIEMRTPFWDTNLTKPVGEMHGTIDRLTGKTELITTVGGKSYSRGDYVCRRVEPRF
jgi:hypothetical protein